jgi:hypothetical protein
MAMAQHDSRQSFTRLQLINQQAAEAVGKCYYTMLRYLSRPPAALYTSAFFIQPP